MLVLRGVKPDVVGRLLGSLVPCGKARDSIPTVARRGERERAPAMADAHAFLGVADCYGALDRAGWRVVEKSQTKIPPQWSKTVVSTTKAVLFLPARTCTPP